MHERAGEYFSSQAPLRQPQPGGMRSAGGNVASTERTLAISQEVCRGEKQELVRGVQMTGRGLGVWWGCPRPLRPQGGGRGRRAGDHAGEAGGGLGLRSDHRVCRAVCTHCVRERLWLFRRFHVSLYKFQKQKRASPFPPRGTLLTLPETSGLEAAGW